MLARLSGRSLGCSSPGVEGWSRGLRRVFFLGGGGGVGGVGRLGVEGFRGFQALEDSGVVRSMGALLKVATGFGVLEFRLWLSVWGFEGVEVERQSQGFEVGGVRACLGRLGAEVAFKARKPPQQHPTSARSPARNLSGGGGGESPRTLASHKSCRFGAFPF